MKTIYMIRHGEIDKSSLFLDENGIKFSKKIVEYFRDIEITYLTSSNVIRCIETILPLSKDKKLNINTFDDYLF
jgi:broad specificity phosphatase PhoE